MSQSGLGPIPSFCHLLFPQQHLSGDSSRLSPRFTFTFPVFFSKQYFESRYYFIRFCETSGSLRGGKTLRSSQDRFVEQLNAQKHVSMLRVKQRLGLMTCAGFSLSGILVVFFPFSLFILSTARLSLAFMTENIHMHRLRLRLKHLRDPILTSLQVACSDNHCNCKDVRINH